LTSALLNTINLKRARTTALLTRIETHLFNSNTQNTPHQHATDTGTGSQQVRVGASSSYPLRPAQSPVGQVIAQQLHDQRRDLVAVQVHVHVSSILVASSSESSRRRSRLKRTASPARRPPPRVHASVSTDPHLPKCQLSNHLPIRTPIEHSHTAHSLGRARLAALAPSVVQPSPLPPSLTPPLPPSLTPRS